ncbi:MAG: haloacid dehalogenase-like hydrolase, partial [Lactobacillus sp.]|nr:haloacid dehalogenase-like hydrolase [Lactobacillus sp.]
MYAFISDFDGTITADDFFTLISERYFDDDMLAPWSKYLDGKETHFNALNEMFAQIHIDEDELKEFIRKIRFDKVFFEVCELCNEKNIPIYICSAGCDYYIKELMGDEIK